jgi:hypothetical protein
MDPFTEFLLLAVLVVGVPAFGLRKLCSAITREIASWAPDRPQARYQLVQVIPQQATRNLPR